MSKLRPILPPPSKPPKPAVSSLTDSRSGEKLRLEPLRPTWTEGSHRPLSTRLRTTKPTSRRCLDFDIETVAVGFGDPDWVPQKVTAIAWSWVDEDEVHVRIALDGVREMLTEFRAAYDVASMVTGHNIVRFDLPVLNADMLRLGFPTLGAKLAQDTIRIVKTKGFKKGQDNLSTLLENPIQKMPLNWQEWQNAYDEPDWATVIDRVTSDVRGHKLLRTEMLRRGWLKPPRMWSP